MYSAVFWNDESVPNPRERMSTDVYASARSVPSGRTLNPIIPTPDKLASYSHTHLCGLRTNDANGREKVSPRMAISMSRLLKSLMTLTAAAIRVVEPRCDLPRKLK